MTISINNIHHAISKFEHSIKKFSNETTNVVLHNSAMHDFSDVLKILCEIDPSLKFKSTTELITAVHQGNSSGKRNAAIICLRALAVNNLMPMHIEQLLGSRIADFISDNFSDQLKHLNLDKKQTHEKIRALSTFHQNICSKLEPLIKIPDDLHQIVNTKQNILSIFRNSSNNTYLQPFNWTILKTQFESLLTELGEFIICADAGYQQKYERVENLLVDLSSILKKNASFLTDTYLSVLLDKINTAVTENIRTAKDRFFCDIKSRKIPPLLAEKRYPLYLADKLITINLPFINSGPGVAVNLTATITCDPHYQVVFENEILTIGDIPPGDFTISFRILTLTSNLNIPLHINIVWQQIPSDRKSLDIDFRIDGQNPNIPWGELEHLEPYSLEVANGDRFVGRTAKVTAIASRLLKEQMSSTYITGQKRIGKTSLAHAVLRFVKERNTHQHDYKTLYLEWGEYCTASAQTTLSNLGNNIFDFFQSNLPADRLISRPSFDGTLAPLNSIIRLLEECKPNTRFIIVLDEFDEIHPELYRYGPLAEAFFANLRTLSAKINVAFILVGGEKMPFIISAQGDQLNKFVRESLNYFSRGEEWDDYVRLIKSPVELSLNWEESAISEIYNLTAGHPYYTKLLCSKVFASAVSERDTEIIVADVRRSLNTRISELDTNAFAHFWKDGINVDRDEAELFEQKRLRLLVAFGRALRNGDVDRNNICNFLNGGKLLPHEINPIIDDFCRRDIMGESAKKLAVYLPIFQQWIRDVGVSKLISNTLGDEIENELQKANDAAYVQSSEITQLAASWPLYRGKEITSESIRAWLDQIPSAREQRMLFKILTNMLFITPSQINELLSVAHSKITKEIAPLTRVNKIEKRRDMLITYLDGPGKSGVSYARAYARENNILLECVIEPTKLARRLGSDAVMPSCIIVIDDLAGTGESISSAIDMQFQPVVAALVQKKIPLFVVTLFSTEKADLAIRTKLSKIPDLTFYFISCRLLGSENMAFAEDSLGFWETLDEKEQAKALCQRTGSKLYSKFPLGYGNLSLMITFPDGCPNNNLPMIFASGTSSEPWIPLLPRAVS